MVMETELKEAMTSGVLVEFRDESNHSLGQAVFLDWRGRPVPAVGDVMSCKVQAPGASRAETLSGRVLARQFDVQTDEAGEPCVWVRILVAAFKTAVRSPAARSFELRFSEN